MQAEGDENRGALVLDLLADAKPAGEIRKTIKAKFNEVAREWSRPFAPRLEKLGGNNSPDNSRNLPKLQCCDEFCCHPFPLRQRGLGGKPMRDGLGGQLSGFD